MKETSLNKKEYHLDDIGGAWKEAMRVEVATTRKSFPGAEVLVHLDMR